jgi:hypothetical protein
LSYHESTTVAIIVVEENRVRVRNWRALITREGAKTDKISADWKKKPF